MFGLALGFSAVIVVGCIILFSFSVMVLKEWERVAVLTLGKYTGLKGPGLVVIFPLVQTFTHRIDMRVKTSKFQFETTLTKDGVAVTVDAVLFWRVIDPEEATLQVTNYQQAVELAAQTTLREVIGRMNLAHILSHLEELDLTLKEIIARKVLQWGIEAKAVEIRDVQIPEELQEVMSRAAQAEREKEARITYGEAEVEAAKKFVEAAAIYASDPNALQLRAMNIMYEAFKSENSTVIVTPSNVVESLNPSVLGVALGKSEEKKQ